MMLMKYSKVLVMSTSSVLYLSKVVAEMNFSVAFNHSAKTERLCPRVLILPDLSQLKQEMFICSNWYIRLTFK